MSNKNLAETITTTEERRIRIEIKWNKLQRQLTSGQKSWLTSCKNHYDEMVKNDPEAAAKILAMNEFTETYMRNNSE